MGADPTANGAEVRPDRSRSPRGGLAKAEVYGKNGKTVDRELLDGFSAAEIIDNPQNRVGYTFDDLICLPGHISFGVHEVSIASRFTRRIKLQVPLVSSPMDTVTESKMAITMALLGGVGVIHKNMPAKDQAEEVRRVKRYKAGMITDPICITPEMTLAELDGLIASCGFSGFPVTEDGKVGSKLLGLVTRRDTDFVQDRVTVTVDKIMTKADMLVTAEHGVSLAQANAKLRGAKKGKLPIVSKGGELLALIARADMKKSADYPLATKDEAGCLVVAAAVGMLPADQERVKLLVAAGVDALVVDAKQGDNMLQHDMVRWIKREFPALQVVGGNVATKGQAHRLIQSGVDAIRVGMGAGSIAMAQDVCACGRAQASAVYQVALVASSLGIPVIADGGIGSPGHILKALSMGADVAMCGSMLAGTEESPGQYYFNEGKRLKRYRGMGTIEAMDRGSSDRWGACGVSVRVAQGVSGSVVDKGTLKDFMPYLSQGLRHGMQDLGCISIEQVHARLRSGELRFEIRSPAAQREGGIHGLHSYQNKLYDRGVAK